MSKKTVYQCDMCYGWYSKLDITYFKKTRYSWKDGRLTTKYDICNRCLDGIEREMQKERRKYRIESGGINE